jgi:hypothetical protein
VFSLKPLVYRAIPTIICIKWFQLWFQIRAKYIQRLSRIQVSVKGTAGAWRVRKCSFYEFVLSLLELIQVSMDVTDQTTVLGPRYVGLGKSFLFRQRQIVDGFTPRSLATSFVLKYFCISFFYLMS